MDEKKRTEQLARLAPQLTDAERRQINGLFPAYIFRRRRTGEVWTSCCGVHKCIVHCENDGQRQVLEADHVPQPQYRWGKCLNPVESGWRVRCPWCGAEAAVKEIGRCGDGKNLWAYRRAVVLRQWRGALWVRAYDCWKDYRLEHWTAPPVVKMLGVYRFATGRAEGISRPWWADGPLGGYREQTAPGKKKLWELSAPYGYCGEYGTGYEVVGLEELGKSAFRYCGAEDLQKHCDLIRLLTACCFYGDKIEWLHKLGLHSAVSDLVDAGKKNARLLNWSAEKPRDFLPVPVKTVQALRRDVGNSEQTMEALGLWRRLRGTGAQDSVEACEALAKIARGHRLDHLTALMRRHGLAPGRLVRYLEKGAGAVALSTRLELWTDYMDAAAGVSLNLENPIFLLPRDLDRKHDETTAAWAAMQDLAKDKKYRKRLRKLTRRYSYTDGTYLIRPPVSGAEIKREGQMLHHCVGGYAGRHMSGATTILFLRRRDRPGKPLVTIEMRGNAIVQIHGWDDERTSCPDNPERISCRELYGAFLEEWIGWLAAGSRRDKRGRPIPPRKIGKESA